MQGVYYKGERLKTKKALKEVARSDAANLSLEATPYFGNDYGGPVLGMPELDAAYVVGPDPHTSRKWYASVTRQGATIFVK